VPKRFVGRRLIFDSTPRLTAKRQNVLPSWDGGAETNAFASLVVGHNGQGEGGHGALDQTLQNSFTAATVMIVPDANPLRNVSPLQNTTDIDVAT
jgi:hypothetical protein